VPGQASTPRLSRRGVRVGIVIGIVVVAAAVVFLARWVSTLAPVAGFLATYDGTAALPGGAPVGLPAWVGWQHFLNAFFLILIIRTGWQVRTQRRPPATWTRNNTGLIKTKNPPKKISLTLFTHLSLDVLWLLNGVVFVVLLFATGQWVRVVPTSWEIVPNALAAALRYVSFDWPTEDGWVNYNALQTLAYFVVIFLAAPLAAVTGARMSPAWPKDAKRLNRAYPIEWARAVHFPVMLFFVLFVIVHVVLVLATGALRNLNHMYGGSDTTTWVGAGIFAGTVVLTVAAVWAARPLVVAPIASLMGRVGN